MTKILVTGGTGFIGSHIADKYLELGHEVIIMDNLSSGLNYANPKIKFYNIDIKDLNALEEIFKQERPEIVNHHAAMNAWDFYEAEKDKILFQSDIAGTFNLVFLSIKYRIKKFIFASSAAIYGDHPSEKLPLEEDVHKNPISLYGLSKLTSEQIIVFYGKNRNLNYVIFRYANIYGPRQEGGVISSFIKNMLSNRVTKIYGNGSKTRDYVYIKDVIEANVLVLTKDSKDIFNVSTGKETSDLEIYNMIHRILDDPHKPVHVEDRFADIKRSSLHPSKIKKILNWNSSYSLDSGLKETIEWFKQKINP